MQEIKSLLEIDYTKNVPIVFLATVISVDSEGDSEKHRPFKATLKLEETGENFQVCSWKFDNLQTFKELVNKDDVYRFEGFPSLYKDIEKQIRVGEIKNIEQKSTRKICNIVNADEIRRELDAIVNTYLPANGPYSFIRKIIDNLIFNNEKFWIWPAATKMHHAYPMGLAKHTLNTTKNAISLWNNYNGSNLNISIIVAGAVLHDIGKLTEYNADGSRTVYGNLVPHPISGYSKVLIEAEKLGLDPMKDTYIIMLLHILLSHHEKLEFGAPTQPNILEAMIVARADCMDAVFECIDNSLNNTEINTTTERLPHLEGLKMFKWHN